MKDYSWVIGNRTGFNVINFFLHIICLYYDILQNMKLCHITRFYFLPCFHKLAILITVYSNFSSAQDPKSVVISSGWNEITLITNL